jgi:NADH dehydrogenase
MRSERAIATVFGGSGFLGRHVVRRLAAAGYTVRVAVRNIEATKFLRTMGDVGQVVPLYAPIQSAAEAVRAIGGAALVINLTGILAESRKGDFTRIHAEGARRLARLASAAHVRQFIHVSALGASEKSPSAYARSKAEGEAAVLEAFPNAVILRPSIIFGAEDSFFNRFASLAVTLPVLPIVHGATRMQPVYVGDVAAAVLAARDAQAAGRIFELGGPEQKTFHELLELMLSYIDRNRLVFDMPVPLARFASIFLGKTLTGDQITLLERDNTVLPGAPSLAELGIIPTRMDLILPTYLARYRPGGRGKNARFQE